MPDYGERKFNCLSGCGEKYKVEPIWDKAPMEGQAENYAPVIIAKISNGGNYITVGNESWPSRENKAVIKSIDLGFVNTLDGSMELVDEDGGALSLFLDSVEKCMSQFRPGTTKMEYQIGWVYTRCDGSQGMSLSPKMNSIIANIETSLSGGLIRFIIKFTTVNEIAKNYREDKTFGEQKTGKTEHLEDAIEQLMALCPTMNVEFGYYDQKGDLIKGKRKLKWLVNGRIVSGGPKAAWQADSQDRFDTIQKWMGNYRIKDGDKEKGAVLIMDPSKTASLLVLMDPNPEDRSVSADRNSNTRHLGTFIVNGGKCSNVLEFNPTFNIANAFGQQSSGGNAKGGLATDNELVEKEKTPDEKKQCESAGVQQTISPSQQIEFTDGPAAFSETNKSQLAHIRANRVFEVQGVVLEADLRIVGSTFFFFYSFEALCAMLSIVVISPFTIRGGKAGRSCGDFLKRADCHPFFSNRKWVLKGVNHSVKEGSFVTTLKVQLPVTGFEIPWGEPFGGDPMGAALEGC